MYISRSSNAYALDAAQNRQRRAEEEELQRRRAARQREMARRRRIFYLICHLFVVFGICAGILFGYGQITKISRENTALMQEYNDLVAKNKKLDVDIQTMQDTKVIEDIAVNQLGMSKPEKYQTVYLDLGKTDQVSVASQKGGEERSGGLMSALSEGFYNVLEYLN